MKWQFWALSLLIAFLSTACIEAGTSAITSLSLSKGSFNPTLGQNVKISFHLKEPGRLTLKVLDRDGYPVRTLISAKQTQAEVQSFVWDGKSDDGTVVPDEAYSFKIDLALKDKTQTYFPANSIQKELPIQNTYYDRQNGFIHYDLSAPARVHIQAGCAKWNSRKKQAEGPVLKTVANRVPKSGGAIIESWNGYDESGTIYVPDQQDFAIAIFATALPENSVITFGNQAHNFVNLVSQRKGKSLFTFPHKTHAHHQGLSTLEDVSPTLILNPQNATYLESERLWQIKDKVLKLNGWLEGPAAKSFGVQPTEILVYRNGKAFRKISQPTSPLTLEIPLENISGPQIVAVNWWSKYGPVTVNALRLRMEESRTLIHSRSKTNE